ncbi:ABC transporter ATP-binding protein [Marinicrinis sediminis]|uniref:ABC transporter ATP-binding protein n=1 Tax=Marinicrinis sediminis TaxID=1652465 RepID=A0ABW5R9P8_9BACL
MDGLKVENLSKSYLNRVIFEQVNLTIDSGQMVAVMGKSGAGKSTLLNIVAGLEKASDGVYHYLSQNMSDKSLSQLAKMRGRHMGYISQQSPMVPKLTVKENILVPYWFGKRDKTESVYMDHLQVLSEWFELKNLLDAPISQLSGGERQRVGIIRALLRQPQLVVADEPTAALDATTAHLVTNCFTELKQDGKIILIATHNREVAAKCDRVYELHSDGLIPVALTV